MMDRIAIRTRLTIVYSVLLFLALALCGGAVVSLLRYRLIQRVEESLDRRLEGVEAFLRRETTAETVRAFPVELEEYASTQPEGRFIEVRDEAGSLLFGGESMSKPAISRTRTFTLYGRRYQTRAYATLGPIEESVQEMTYLFALSAPVLLLFIGFAGYWISSRSLRPVDEMTRVARSLDGNTLGVRLAVPPAKDEISRLAEAWNEMLVRIEESFLRMQRFTADAAHEFRTPLTGLRTTAELALRRPREPQEYRDALREIVTISEQINHLSDGLLALARGEDSPDLSRSGLVDVSSLVQTVITDMRSVLTQKDLVIEFSSDERPTLPHADADGIRRIAAVLLDNARKYTPAGGRITVSLRQSAADVELEVSDTGCGIPEEALPRIFDRFYRIDPSRDRETGGFGLGLSIAQQIALAHHGNIEVSSKLGAGASFRFKVPKNTPPEA